MQFDLTKSTETLQFVLEKNEVKIKPCQVTFTMDVSSSFDTEHKRGYTQELLNRFVPFAMLFDKDKTLGSFVFANQAEELDDINESNYNNYIQRKVITSDAYYGGTYYGEAFKLLHNTCCDKAVVETIVTKPKGIIGKLFGKEKVEEVVTIVPNDEKYLHIFVTDGVPLDGDSAKYEIEQLIKQTPNMFILFLSISDSSVEYLNRNFKNTNYSSYINYTVSELRNLESVSDDELYSELLSDQLVTWMNK